MCVRAKAAAGAASAVAAAAAAAAANHCSIKSIPEVDSVFREPVLATATTTEGWKGEHVAADIATPWV